MYGSGSTFVDDPFIDFDEFPIIPSGVTVTNYGTWTNDLNLGNSKSLKTFDGTNNYITISNHTDFSFGSGDFSFCGWVKFPSTTISHAVLGPSDASATASTRGTQFSFYKSGTPVFAFSYWDTSSTRYDFDSIHTYSDSIWYHFAVIRSGSILTMYINGIIENSTSISVTLQSPTTVFGIGSIGLYTSSRWYGQLKDIMIFKGRALTQPEIKLLMNRTHPITGRGLIDSGKYWRLS